MPGLVILFSTAMTRYVAFLRGINVGGRKLIKMDDLAGAFVSLKLNNVRTYIASGNVIFETALVDTSALTRTIERKLLQVFGHEIAVVLQTSKELAAHVKRNPFKKINADKDVMLSVTFLTAEPQKRKLPLRTRNEMLEVLAVKDRAAYIVCHRKKTGSFEFPNNFLRRSLGSLQLPEPGIRLIRSRD